MRGYKKTLLAVGGEQGSRNAMIYISSMNYLRAFL